MQILSVPLNELMGLCYTITGNYIIAILVFTLLTKIILLPVSLWMQRNSVKMVELTPDLNRLKIKYFGDKDTIAEETQKLYKEKKYHQFLSMLPMVIQLVLLMGVIAAVKYVLGDSGNVLLQIPVQYGGLTLSMPVAAGLSALLLGLNQNRFNPLQREQGKAEQWMTNGISIAISLVLGFFVSVGVCIYWIASNLFTIAQQQLLNAIINPKRYVDYESLRKSKEDLEKMNSLSSNISKEDKKREKADYKRFFSVANKHLVFYSEKSGFYKYFQGVIEELLRSSNVTIHYVTSDPNDQIFEIAKVQPKIRPYYIGEKRLITLMMKMDADIVVMTMPDIENFHIKRSYLRKDIEYIYMFHGIGSSNMLLRTGALAHYDTIFCIGEYQKEELIKEEAVYGLSPRNLVECGYNLIDSVIATYEKMPKVANEKKQVLFAPSWQADNIMDSAIDGMLESLLGQDLKIVVRPHPEYCKRYPQKIKAFRARYGDKFNEDFVLQTDFSSNETVFTSDLVITDWSTICYEYAFATKRPVLFVNTPMKVMNPEYEKLGIVPMDIASRTVMGQSIELNELEKTADVVHELLEHSEEYKEKIDELFARCVYNPGRSSMVGKDYILRRLIEKQKAKA